MAGLLAVLASAAAFDAFRARPVEPTRVPFDFLKDVQADRVTSVVAEGDTLTFDRRDGTHLETVAPLGYIATNPTLVATLIERGVRFDVSANPQPGQEGYAALVIGILVCCAVGVALFRVTTGRVSTLERGARDRSEGSDRDIRGCRRRG